jgi:hypothetical protein
MLIQSRLQSINGDRDGHCPTYKAHRHFDPVSFLLKSVKLGSEAIASMGFKIESYL